MQMVGIMGMGKWGEALSVAMSEKNLVKVSSNRAREYENFVSIEALYKLEFLLFALSTQHTYPFLKKHPLKKRHKILVCTKGIEQETGLFMDDIFEKFLPQEQLCFLNGPSFAVEVKAKKPTAICISGVNLSLAKTFASFFPKNIKTYTDDDVKGAGVCGAYKNIIAIAAGICAGLNLGENAKAALISRGLVEMHRFAQFYGAKEATFYGLSGAGDLFLTANSIKSRNYRTGLLLTKNQTLDAILNEIGEACEGIWTAKAVYKLLQIHRLYLPIAKNIYEIIFEQKHPAQAVDELLK